MKGSDVLVINEPFVQDFCRTQRWAARTRGRVLRAPDWLAYATAVLEERGFDVALYDFPARNWDKPKLKELVREVQPKFVVLDTTTPSIYSDIECARMVKDVSQAEVIFVGPHASALPEETLSLAQGAADFVCIGEYDYSVAEVVAKEEKAEDIPGIAYLGPAGPKLTTARPLIKDLDALPFPAWHHLNLLDYFDGTKLFPYIDIFSGRGCPYGCIFCLWPQVMHGRGLRLRSPSNVVDEMERDIELCPQVLKGGEFFFEDDTFTVNRKFAASLCEEIRQRGLKVAFSVNARTDTTDLELFKLMKAAGCRELLVGFESGVQDILDGMGKGATVEGGRQLVHCAKKAGLDVHGCFVLGLPGETEATMQETVDYAMSLELTTLQFSASVPFPGTRLFSWCQEKGLIKSTNWSDWLADGEQAPVVSMPGLEQKVVQKYVDEALKSFYLRPTYMIKFLLKTRSRADLYRKLRGAKNFFQYLFFNSGSKSGS